MVFGSKRLDGVFTRIFITHVDPAARFTKPLLLPQEDPAYYETCLDNFNVPELVRGPVRVTEEELARALNTPASATQPSARESAAPYPASSQPTQ